MNPLQKIGSAFSSGARENAGLDFPTWTRTYVKKAHAFWWVCPERTSTSAMDLQHTSKIDGAGSLKSSMRVGPAAVYHGS